MDGARAQAKIWRGYGLAAAQLGQTFSHYRPANWTTPVQDANLLGELAMSVTTSRANNFEFGKSEGPDDYVRNALIDGATLEPRDLLVREGETYFVGSLQHLLPIAVVACDRMVSVRRPVPSAAQTGLASYSGLTQSRETVLASDVPAAIFSPSTTTAKRGLTPADSAGPVSYKIWLPLPQGAVRERDVVADDLGNRFQVYAALWTLLGYRLETTRLQA